MATLTPQSVGVGSVVLADDTLVTGDDFLYKKGARQMLIFSNTTGGAAILNIVGDSASSEILLAGTAVTVDASAGYDINLADGSTIAINTASIDRYLEDSNNLPVITSDTVGITVNLVELV